MEVHAKYDTEFPLTNLAIINNGNCRFCRFQKEISSKEDITELQQHYKTNHVVRFIRDARPEMSTLAQEENSFDPSKCYHYSLPNPIYIYIYIYAKYI